MKIEQNVPIPPRAKKYPWRTMKKGDSFLVKTPKARDNALRTARQAGVSATSRKLKNGMYRLWRES